MERGGRRGAADPWPRRGGRRAGGSEEPAVKRAAGLGWRTESAVAGIGLLSVMMFRRLFADWSFLPEVVGAAVLPLVIGGVGRRLRLPASLSFLLSLVVGWLYITWTLFPESTSYGVPWKGSVKE